MKRLIILLSVILTALCGCSNIDNKTHTDKYVDNEVSGEDKISSESVETETIITEEPTTTMPVTTPSVEETIENSIETPTEETTEVTTAKPTEIPTQKPTEEVATKPTETPTQKPTEVTTQKPTEAPTAKPTETPTKAPTEMETLPPIEEQPTAPPLPTYDIYSEEYARLVKEYTLQYINEYRAAEGNVPLTNLPFVAEYSQGRSTQLVTNFAHDTDDERAMATKLKYGRYINPVEYGLEGEPYYSPSGAEAICKMSISKYTSPEAMARKTAKGLSESPGHWKYVGGTMDVYENHIYSGIGATVDGGYMYICVTVDDIKWE